MKPPRADRGGGTRALGALLVGTRGGGKTRGPAVPPASPAGRETHRQYRAVAGKEPISSRTLRLPSLPSTGGGWFPTSAPQFHAGVG